LHLALTGFARVVEQVPQLVPPEPVFSFQEARRDEDRRLRVKIAQNRMRDLEHVAVTIIDGDDDRARILDLPRDDGLDVLIRSPEGMVVGDDLQLALEGVLMDTPSGRIGIL